MGKGSNIPSTQDGLHVENTTRLEPTTEVPGRPDNSVTISVIDLDGSGQNANHLDVTVADPEKSENDPPQCRCRAPCACIQPEVDGKWSWVVMVTSLLMAILVDGIAFSFGVLLPELLESFPDSGREKVASVGTVLSGVYLFAGPLASALSAQFGYRPVAMAGGLISAVGFLGASFSPNVEVLIALYGGLGGLGFSFMFLTSLVCVTMYFNKWRPIAVGVASCGSGVGIFIFPVLIRAILDHYGWEQTILIQAGFVLMGVLLGMTFLPIETKHRQKKGFKTALKSAFDVSLLKDPIFIILAIMAVTSTIGILIPFVFTPDMAEGRGVDRDQAAFLVSIMGISNTVGRVVVGVVAFKIPAHPLFLLTFGHLWGGAITMLISLYTTYSLLATYSGLFGIVYAMDAALSTVILARVLGTERLSGAFGLLCLCRGVASVGTGPLAAYLVSVTGDYNATFYLAGSALLVTAVLCITAWLLVRRRRDGKGQRSYDVTSESWRASPDCVPSTQDNVLLIDNGAFSLLTRL